MREPPTGHSSSIGSSSSFSSSFSSLLVPPIDEVSSQSDVAEFAPYPSMPRGGPYDIAASPEHVAVKTSPSAPAVSTTQKIKRAFAKRRRPSQDANAVLSSGDESWTSGFGSSTSNQIPSSSKSSKLSMNLFTSRKHDHSRRTQQSPQSPPPPVPPKPIKVAIPAGPAAPPPPRASFMVTSPSINAAIEFMRTEDQERQRAMAEAAALEQRQQRQRAPPPTEAVKISEETKEKWRRSDSTMDSGHTVRPANAQESGSRRVSAYLASSTDKDMDLLEFLAGAPLQETQRQGTRTPEPPVGRQSKRRSRSLNIHVPLSQAVTSIPSFNVSQYPAPLSTTDLRNPGYPAALNSAPLESRYGNPINIVGASQTNAVTVKPNIRDRLVAWTAAAASGVSRSHSPSPSLGAVASTSSPSLHTHSTSVQIDYRRPTLPSEPSQSDSLGPMHARVRSPSNSSLSSTGGIRQAASGALGFAKRAGEKVGRVWGNSGNGSGSGSDTSSHRHPSPVPGQNSAQQASVAPSAFLRRTPGGTSGMWSVGSQSGSRSSSERDGRETPVPFAGTGRLVRPPKDPRGGLVFKRELWECVKDTRTTDPDARDELAKRMIPALVYRCVQHIHKWGLDEEGLFRVTGRASHVTRLRSDFDGGADYDIIDCSPSELDPHAVASVLKAYLRELPESILTRSLAPLFDNAVNAENSKATIPAPTGSISKAMGQAGSGLPGSPRPLPMPGLRKPPSLSTFVLPTSSSLRAPSITFIETLSELVSRLPRENYDLLLSVVELMRVTASRSKVTKMPLSNLLLVFCPSLNMSPSLLRALCDNPSIWERTPAFARPSPAQETEEAESDHDSTDSDSLSDEEDMVIHSSLKGKGREVPMEDTQSECVVEDSVEDAEPTTDDDIILVPMSRKRAGRIVRPSSPCISQIDGSIRSATPSPSRPMTPLRAPLIGGSDSSPSLEVPASSQDDSSPQRSEVSLSSLDEVSAVSSQSKEPVPTPRVPIPRKVVDYDKSLPASPQSPEHRIQGNSSSGSPTSSVEALATEAIAHGASDTQLPYGAFGREQNSRSATVPSPLAVGSQSAPNVVFPSYGTAPSTPTSPLKKHALNLSLGRMVKSEDDEAGSPVTPSRRVMRRPSINMLFNMKRSGSPTPRIRTQTISSPLTSPISFHEARAAEEDDSPPSPKTITNPLPPVLDLNLNLGGSSSDGLWDDVFGGYGSQEMPSATQSSYSTSVAQSSQPPQPRQLTVSSPSSHTPSSSLSIPASPSRRPTTEYLLSSGGFFSPNGPPTILPSAEAILAAASEPAIAVGAAHTIEAAHSMSDDPSDAPAPARSPTPSEELNTVALREDISSGDDSPPLSSPKEPYASRPSSPMETFSSPPLISFPLRGSLDEEDWASAVLEAASKPDASDT